jgi:DNA-binding transcriptional LysR family regulator
MFAKALRPQRTRIVERNLAKDTLVELLPQIGGRSRPFNLLYPHSRFVPSRVRAFIDFLTARVDVRNPTAPPD